MAGNRTLLYCVLGISSVICLGLWRQRIDVVLWGGRTLLTLALLTLIISVVTPWIPSSRVSVSSNSHTVPEDEVERLKRLARQEQQEQLSLKASSYMEQVIKPRQDLKLKKQEEQFYKMTGQSWKLTEGQRLGETEESDDNFNDKDTGDETANKEALRKRKLPENVTKPVPKPEQPQPKKVITLPEEPTESDEGVVTIALRCPSGRLYRRRFYKSCSSLVLMDWMMKIGYHSVIYTLCTPYPRCQLDLKQDLTLENIGILTDTVLNVEEKDPS
ncbi:UBX domain-containing protein 8 [Discoglossus pictus]